MLSNLESDSESVSVSGMLHDASLSGELSELYQAVLATGSAVVDLASSVYRLFGVASFVGNPGCRVLLCGRIPAVVERVGVAVRPGVIGLMMRRAVAVGGVVVPIVVLVVVVRLGGLNTSGEEGRGEKC